MWERVVRESLPAIRTAVPPGSRVLEVGYGDGLLSCWLAKELGWRIVGLDVRPEAHESAARSGELYGLSDRLDFRLCRPEETRLHGGPYDAVFVKTVFYSAASVPEYEAWLDWVNRVLRPGGILVNFESGRANEFVQIYRRLRRRPYADRCLYTARIEELYERRFETIFRRHYGGLSQFMAPIPGLYEGTAWFEEALSRRKADNCFAVSVVARKRQEERREGNRLDG
jgi:cyclopropane fatty-acyl-phospholipid synthase-like methyltransferase